MTEDEQEAEFLRELNSFKAIDQFEQMLKDMTVNNPFNRRRDAVQNPATLIQKGESV